MSLERNAPSVGTDVEVLVEGPSKRNPEHWFGKTRQFKTAVFPRRSESVGDLATIRVAAVSPYTLFGEGVPSTVQAVEDATP
jgi:tRNA-2-methylthio-N6-dimethylallyladenosine synthase